MMKKILYILGFLMFTSAVYRPVVALGLDKGDCAANTPGQFPCQEEDVPFSSARIFSKLVGATGLDPNADWGDTFGEDDEEDVGQNLYALIYGKIEHEPEQTANTNVAGRYGLNRGEMVRLLNGDYSTLVERKPTIRQEELIVKIQEIQNEHRTEVALQQLRANVKSAVESSEIFANDDLGDSGFDLIHDLRRIEELLFLQTAPIDIGQSYVSADGGFAPIGQAITPGGNTPPAGSVGSQSSALVGAGGGTGTGENSSPGLNVTAAEYSAASATTDSSAYADGTERHGVNPNSCFAANLYDDALTDFAKKASGDANYKDGTLRPLSAEGSQFSDSTTSDQSQTGDNQNIIAVGPGEDPLPRAVQVQPPALAAAAGDWSGEEFCDGVICLEVNFVTKPATSSFQNSDNCIACHAQKIQDVLKKTISYSLVPSKAPGNILEGAQCKKASADAFSNVNMEIYAVLLPIPTPAHNNLIAASDYQEDYFGFCQNSFFPFDVCKRNPAQDNRTPEQIIADAIAEYQPAPLLTEQATKKVLSQIREGASQEEVTQRIQEVIRTYTIQQNTAVEVYATGKNADEKILLYGPLASEMSQMNYYFASMRDILHSLHDKVENAPGRQACTELFAKKQCD